MTSMIGTGSRILLWLFVINLGIAFGAGLYESRIVTPEWLSSSESVLRWSAEAARRDNTGMRFWIFVTTVPLTIVTLANAITAWRTEGAGRNWWLGAAALAPMERTVTFSYFIPVMGPANTRSAHIREGSCDLDESQSWTARAPADGLARGIASIPDGP